MSPRASVKLCLGGTVLGVNVYGDISYQQLPHRCYVEPCNQPSLLRHVLFTVHFFPGPVVSRDLCSVDEKNQFILIVQHHNIITNDV